MVEINSISFANGFFGGYKQSGNGRGGFVGIRGIFRDKINKWMAIKLK